jgi:transglutaminase-like putative cysteine protease
MMIGRRRSVIAVFMCLIAIGAAAAEALGSPPSGRPPAGALERYDPRLYRVGFEVELDNVPPPRLRRDVGPTRVELQNAEFYLPVILQSTFSRVRHDSLTAYMWFNDFDDHTINNRRRLDHGLPFHTSLAVLPVQQFSGHNVRWRVEQQVQVWSSRIDDARAGEVTWPRRWPDEVQNGLRPQRFIESDDPVFREAIERLTQGRLRIVPPYHAAKEIVRHVLQNMQVSGARTHRREMFVIEGVNVVGAKQAGSEGIGSAHDIVCLCVAMLRAADIPARPVVGFMRMPPRNRFEIVSWAEFYLPDTGWIPFDPVAMQGKGLHREVHEPWPEFGSIRDLNERIPLAYGFTPARGEMGPGPIDLPEVASIWGWNLSSRGAPGVRQQIRLSMESLGRVREDEH